MNKEKKMNSRIRLKMGDIEVEYEGSEDFVKTELINLVSEVANLYRESGLYAGSTAMPRTANEVSLPPSAVAGTTGAIASRLSSKSGTDLVIAAAAHLALVKGLASFTRQQLLEEMRTATAYYKKSYTNNLSRYLQTLLKAGDLFESAKDTYALSAGKREELEKLLAR